MKRRILTPFQQEVLDAVNKADVPMTVEALRDANGRTRTWLGWYRCLDKLAGDYHIERQWLSIHPGESARHVVFTKKVRKLKT